MSSTKKALKIIPMLENKYELKKTFQYLNK